MDVLFMKRCLELARLGQGQVAPNPMVGCVIVHDDKIIGEGYHEKFGEAHAESRAIESVSDQALLSTSTLYVNLEPCTHMGKTASCSDLILQSKIAKVVIGSIDTNEDVQGGGSDHLKNNGCEVLKGVMEADCLDLNRRFFTYHKEKRPYVILKWAESRDGFIAPGNDKQRWITGDESKRLVHKWRAEESAIMVGTNTVIIDNPSLSVRLWSGENPLRVTIDNQGRIPPSANLLKNDAATIVYGLQEKDSKNHVIYVRTNNGEDQLPEILKDLHKREILSLIVEGGAQLLNSFIELGAWDEARVFTGKDDFSDGVKAPKLNIETVDEEVIGGDDLRLYRNTS